MAAKCKLRIWKEYIFGREDPREIIFYWELFHPLNFPGPELTDGALLIMTMKFITSKHTFT